MYLTPAVIPHAVVDERDWQQVIRLMCGRERSNRLVHWGLLCVSDVHDSWFDNLQRIGALIAAAQGIKNVHDYVTHMMRWK